MLVWFQALLKISDQQSHDKSLKVLTNYSINQNSSTVEPLIGLAWNAEHTLYLYFLDIIKLHWELYVFITSFPTA